MLREHGHRVSPVHPRLAMIEDQPVVAGLAEIDENVDTVSLYVNPVISEPLAAALIAHKPLRVIFIPGTESPSLADALKQAGIQSEDACTLVLLSTVLY